MSSQRRIRASRANGRLSRGPVTPEGKERSKRNALRHGMLAKCCLLDSEDTEAFHDHIDQYLIRFQPADDIEAGFVEEMVAASWRLRRSWAIETRMLNN